MRRACLTRTSSDATAVRQQKALHAAENRPRCMWFGGARRHITSATKALFATGTVLTVVLPASPCRHRVDGALPGVASPVSGTESAS
jgi:hypothetical protein